jgi:hypothetical protein
VTGTSSTHADHDSTIVASAGTLTIGGRRRHPDWRAHARRSRQPSTARRTSASALVVQNGGNFQPVLTGQSTGAANSFAITNGLSGGAGVAFSATNAQDAANAEAPTASPSDADHHHRGRRPEHLELSRPRH